MVNSIKPAGTSKPKSATPINLTPDLLTPKDGAKLIHCHPITLRRYRAQGILAAFRLPGGRVRYKRADLLALLEVCEG
jgi:hypothetical protein